MDATRTPGRPCIDCGKVRFDRNRTPRCRGCAQRQRWTNRDDPRRTALIARNKASKDEPLYEDFEWFRRKYQDENSTLRQIAKDAGCSLRTAARWREIHRIPARFDKRAEPRIGPQHHLWTGRTICQDCGGKKSHGSQRCRGCKSRHERETGIADISWCTRQWAYDHWRPLVFERDRYTCQVCGDSRGGNLHAHHIRHLSSIINSLVAATQHDINTAIGRSRLIEDVVNNDQFVDLNNGITLCKDCHWEWHRKEGWSYHRPSKKGAKTT